MSDMDPKKEDIDGTLEGLRRELALRARQAGTIEAVAGGPVDRDIPKDYWSLSDEDLEAEMWRRVHELDQATLDPARVVDLPGGGFRKLVWRLFRPLARRMLARQAHLNRQFEDLLFVQFLAIKQLRRRLLQLERESRELDVRLSGMEIEKAPGGEDPET